MAKKPKTKRNKAKPRKRVTRDAATTASEATLKTLERTWNTAKLRSSKTNSGLNAAIKEAEEFRYLNPRAFKLAMKFMAADPFRARGDWDDLEVYLDLLGFNARKPADLFKDKAPKAEKKVTTARGSGGLVPIGDAIAKAVENAKAKPEESNVTPLRQAAE